MLAKTDTPKIVTIKVGQHRGSRRVWLEGKKPESCGFLPGKRFNVVQNEDLKQVSLVLAEDGARVVSRKRKEGREIPVIDVNSNEALAVLDGIETVQLLLAPGRIDMMPI